MASFSKTIKRPALVVVMVVMCGVLPDFSLDLKRLRGGVVSGPRVRCRDELCSLLRASFKEKVALYELVLHPGWFAEIGDLESLASKIVEHFPKERRALVAVRELHL